MSRVSASLRRRLLHFSARIRSLEYEEGIPPHRIKMEEVLQSHPFDLAVCCALCLNIVLLVLQTNAQARGDDVSVWVSYAEYGLTILYCIELGLKIYVKRLRLLFCPRDVLDACIISSDLMFVFASETSQESLPSPALLRVFRIARLGRVISLLHIFPELWTMMAGLAGAVKVIFWGILLINIWLVILSIVAVQVIHPINLEVAAQGTYDGCERCPRAFSSVQSAILTFTQTLLAGDGWGQLSVPIIEQAPLTYFYFLIVLTTVCIAVVNLILAAIVEAAQQARMVGEREIVRMKEAQFEEAKDDFLDICEKLDKDQTGSLSLEELQNGFHENREFSNCMKAMDVTFDDLGTVFNILDQDRSGDVNYAEFASQIHKMKTNDSHMMLVFIKHYTKKMHDDILQGVTDHLKASLAKLESLERQLNACKDGPAVIAGSEVPSPPLAPPLSAPTADLSGSCTAAVAKTNGSGLPWLPLETKRTQIDVCRETPGSLRQLGQALVPSWHGGNWVQADGNLIDAKLQQLESIFELACNDAKRLMDTQLVRYHARIEL